MSVMFRNPSTNHGGKTPNKSLQRTFDPQPILQPQIGLLLKRR